MNTPPNQSVIQVAYETKVGIFTSKTQEDVKVHGSGVKEEDETSLPVTRDMRDIGIDGWDDLKGGGETEKERNGIGIGRDD